jgi:hypothetical protein
MPKLSIVKPASTRWPHIEFPVDVGKILTAQHVLNFVVVCFYCKDEESCDDVQDVDIRGGFAWIKSCSKCLEKARLDRDKLEPYFNK